MSKLHAHQCFFSRLQLPCEATSQICENCYTINIDVNNEDGNDDDDGDEGYDCNY